MAGDATPKIGVYICHCGGNISDVADPEMIARFASALLGVAVARTNMFMCSDPGQKLIADDIQAGLVDHVVVAACSPKLHELTFRSVLQRSGLNPYLYEHANIREQVSWATSDHAEATAKSESLVAAAVAKAGRLQPLDPIVVKTTPRAAVLGAGVAGLRAARDLAEGGIEVALVEKTAALGGNVAKLDRLFPNEENADELIGRLVGEVLADERITLYTLASLERAEGYVGNFTLYLRQQAGGAVVDRAARLNGGTIGAYRPFEGFVIGDHDAAEGIADGGGDERAVVIEAGALVAATGFEHYTPSKGEYGFGRLPQVVTLPDFIQLMAGVEPGGHLEHEGRPIASVGFIHCVGSRQVEGVNKPQADGAINEYCSRVCCTATLEAICDLQEKCPGVAVYDFYQDIRAYGRGHEDYYEKASKGGAVFVRFAGAEPPAVAKAPAGDPSPVTVRCKDGLTWGEEVEAGVDLLVLAVGMTPSDVSTLVDSLKLPVGTDRFLLEVHPKLRPVELAVHGVLVAGASQGPKDVTEATATASAAAAKAMTLLSAGQVELDPFVAKVDPTRCEGHGLCVQECEYPGALALIEENGATRAVVNPALCSGCGACVAVCPTNAIDVAGWTLGQYEAMVDALLAEPQEVAP